MKRKLVIIFCFFLLTQLGYFEKASSSILVDINSAPIEELLKIIHIGEARAKEIINLRPFYSIDDLAKIKGIGEKSIENIKKQGIAWVDPSLCVENKEKKMNEEIETEEISSNKIDINSAPIEELVKIIHIGEARAKELINLRPFYLFEDLMEIRGIGEKSVKDIEKQGIAWIDPSLYKEEKEENKEEKEIIINSNYQNKRMASVGKLPYNVLSIATIISIFSAIIIFLLKKSLK